MTKRPVALDPAWVTRKVSFTFPEPEGADRRDLFTGMEAIGDGFQGLGHG